MFQFALYLALLFLTGCSTQQVSMPPKVNLKLVNDSISVNVKGQIRKLHYWIASRARSKLGL